MADQGLAEARDSSAALRDAVATYQAAPDGTPERADALAGAVEVAARLPAELSSLAETFRARPDDLFIPPSAASDPSMGLLLETYLSADGGASQLSLVTADEPYSPAAFETVGKVRTLLADWTGGTGAASGEGTPEQAADQATTPTLGLVSAAHVGGPTATSADVQAATTEDFKLVGLITVIGVFVVLVLLLRSLVAPLYLVGSVLLSFGTTMGVATLIFQGVMGQDGLNYLVPLIVFVLLVALGSDYNIFLMSRVREESTTRDLREGITIASARTGTVITSAGIILAGTFAATHGGSPPGPPAGRPDGRHRRAHRHAHRAQPAHPGPHRAHRRARLVALPSQTRQARDGRWRGGRIALRPPRAPPGGGWLACGAARAPRRPPRRPARRRPPAPTWQPAPALPPRGCRGAPARPARRGCRS